MPVEIEPGTMIAGKYRVDGLLGTGGMGSVFAATNTAIARKVAIKVLIADMADRADIKQRFELEARASAVIGHPGIVDVLDMGETDDGEPFIVMEYLEGATLRSVMKALGSLTPGQTVAVVGPMLEALAAAHQAGVIHRDVKPANVWVATKPARAIKLLDFGISRFGKGTGLTMTGAAVGTPQYMSPEQVMGEKAVGPEADLYSVGAVMYQLLGGRAPYEADSDLAALARALTQAHQPLKKVRPELPDGLCKLVDQLLTKDRELRPRDALAVRRKLLMLADPEPDVVYETALELAKSQPQATPLPKVRSRATNAPKKSTARQPASDERTQLPESASPPVALIAVGVALLVFIGVGTTVLVMRKGAEPTPVAEVPKPPAPQPKPPPVEPPVIAPPPPVEAVDVEVTVSLEPAEARLSVGGKPMDCNPCNLTRAKGTTLQVTASLDRYTPADVEIVFDQSRPKTIKLKPLAAVDPPPPGKKREPAKKQPKPGLQIDESNPFQ